MKLYCKSGACSLSPHIALLESGLPFTVETVDLATKVTETGKDFKAINPKGYVPALELDDGSLLTEGSAIVLYIASKAAPGLLAPAMGTSDYFHVLEWLTFIGTELHKGCGPFFNPAMTAEGLAPLKARLQLRLDTANAMLGKGPYVMGNHFTVADGYLFTVLGWLPAVGLDLAAWPNLARFRQTVAARPKVQEALKAEGLAAA